MTRTRIIASYILAALSCISFAAMLSAIGGMDSGTLDFGAGMVWSVVSFAAGCLLAKMAGRCAG